ncbi:hypothetical protein AKJ09_04315 [Labilithrix luteola]|uniref:Uncharacterized protein n=1 Tax=Labilithrix luteola TaxID=1391654 RepID=A0A0K1PW77_9BACT|nr:hypothetical protein AKJ09_04315 [Labilithrix luteola]
MIVRASTKGDEPYVRGTVLKQALAAFEAGHVTVASPTGAPIAWEDLSLVDFHVLAAVFAKIGLVDEEEVEVDCHNCGASLRVAPCSKLEISPWVDDELGDPELDETLPFAAPYDIPAIDLGRVRRVNTVALEARTVGLARTLIASEHLAMSEAVVQAAGIVALGQTREPARIASALDTCSEASFAAITHVWGESHYPARLAGIVRCASCGARNDVDAPFDRELSWNVERHPSSSGDEVDAEEGFPSLETFTARAEEIAAELFARVPGEHRPLLVVEGGTAAVDDGGVPLLGSYVPPPPAPTVSVYYTTFRAMWNEDGPYDWDDELLETIEHELEHHVYFLRGADPMDDEEHAEIDAEERRLVGHRETDRRAVAAFGASFSDFLRRTWILWVLVALAFAFTLATQR